MDASLSLATRTVSGTGEAADLRFQFQFRVIPRPLAETEQSRAPRPYMRTNLISRRANMEKRQDLRGKILPAGEGKEARGALGEAFYR